MKQNHGMELSQLFLFFKHSLSMAVFVHCEPVTLHESTQTIAFQSCVVELCLFGRSGFSFPVRRFSFEDMSIYFSYSR